VKIIFRAKYHWNQIYSTYGSQQNIMWLACWLLQLGCCTCIDLGRLVRQNFWLHAMCTCTDSKMAVSILPPKCWRQQLSRSYCSASPKLGRNEV